MTTTTHTRIAHGPTCDHGPVVLANPKAWLDVAMSGETRGRRVWCEECLQAFELDATGNLFEIVG